MIGLEFERRLFAKQSDVEEGGGTATAVDTSEEKSQYDATDPGYEVDDTALKAEKSDEESEETKDSGEAEKPADEAAEAPEEDAGEEASDEDESFSDELLDRAVALGYTFDDIKSFRSVKSLEREINRVERLAERIKPQADIEKSEEPDFDKMIAEGYDEKQVNLLKAQHERLKRIEAENEEYRLQRETESIAAKEQRFEASLAALGDEYKDLFGSGPGREMKRASKEFQNRAAVFQKMGILAAGYQAIGARVPDESVLFKDALAAVANGHVTQVARQKLKNDIKNAGKQAVSRPHAAGAAGLTGRAKAERRLEEYFRTHE